MAKACPNCGQPTLETDITCWHCGWQLAPQKTARPVTKQRPTATAALPYPLSTIMLYGAMTAVVLIALLLVMRSLGQKPLITIHPETRLGANWTPVTDGAQRFTLDLPADWRWLDGDSDQRALTDALAEDGRFHAALAPLGDLIEAGDILLIASYTPFAADDLAGLVVVAHSEILDRLTPEQAIQWSGQNTADLVIQEARLAEGFTGVTHALLLVENPNSGWRCRQHFTPGPADSFLVAACAPRSWFPRYAGDLQNIVASFQLLAP
jgi:hypothetical protein